jgi:hypothetical protein
MVNGCLCGDGIKLTNHLQLFTKLRAILLVPYVFRKFRGKSLSFKEEEKRTSYSIGRVTKIQLFEAWKYYLKINYLETQMS